MTVNTDIRIDITDRLTMVKHPEGTVTVEVDTIPVADLLPSVVAEWAKVLHHMSNPEAEDD